MVSITRSFTISVVAAGNAAVNLAAPTGRTLSKRVFGFSTGQLADVDATANPNTHFYRLGHATLQTSIAQIRPSFLHIDARQNIVAAYAQGYTSVLANLWTNQAACFDPALLLMVGTGPSNADFSLSASQWASYSANFATAMRNAGHPVSYWSVGDDNGAMTGSDYAAYFCPIADALHSIDPNCLVGATGGASWSEINIANFLSAGGSGSGYGVPRLGFFCFHDYTTVLSDSNYAAYQKARAVANDIISVRAALAGTSAAAIPIFISEYNMDGIAGEEPRQGQYQGALYAALALSGAFRSDGNFSGAGLLDLYSATGYYGAIGNATVGAGNEALLDPQAYYLARAGSSLPGPEYQASTTVADMDIVATRPSATTFAIQLTNYNASADRSVNLQLLGRVPSGAITRWELGKSNTTPVISSQASLGSISVPSETIVILSGTTS